MSSTHYALNFPINSVSFGQVSVAILRELYTRGENPPIFPIGPVDVSAQRADKDFEKWLAANIGSAEKRHNRKNPTIKLWHIKGSLEAPSANTRLITFYECDDPTDTELNILRQHEIVYVTTYYTKSVLENAGLTNVRYLPLGFDSFNFQQFSKRPKIDNVLSFSLFGKTERRKSTMKQIRLWAKKYGNDKRYRLNAAIDNPFLTKEDQHKMIDRALGGKSYDNITFLPFSPTNAEYNAVLQSSDITLSCSLSEGFDLPTFQATAMGAWPIALNAHAYKDYLTPDNAILVEPKGMTPAYDNVFFVQGRDHNQGNFFDFSDEAYLEALDKAEATVKAKGLNVNGMELQKWSYKQTVDTLLGDLA